MRTTFGMVAALVTMLACSGGKPAAGSGGSAAAPPDSAPRSVGGTPVTMGQVTRTTLTVTVSGPGVTDAVEDQRVRAPFNGTLLSLGVQLGDQVRQGQVIGVIVSQTSEAAVRGAQAMLRSARTPADRANAERAVTIAARDLVRTPLVAPGAGVVIARPASPGELLAQGDSIVSIAASGSMVFYADIPQTDLARVRPGQRASVLLTARSSPVAGVVHAILPADTGSTASMRVRIDLATVGRPVTVGLYGSARIVVAERPNALVVPRPSVLRDDITGLTRVALVTSRNQAHWVDVRTGITDSTWAEILAPPLPIGQRVITTGQVGLPEGTPVVEMAPAPAAGYRGNGGGE